MTDRIFAAARAGFDAVECHFPYDTPASEVRAALDRTKLPMLSLNTRLGVNGQQDFGVAARPDRVEEARQAIDEAIAYAASVGCLNINVVPGKTAGVLGAELCFRENLAYACERAAASDISVLIEPISQHAAPNFHCSSVEDALLTINAVGAENLKLMLDCFHTQLMQGNLEQRLRDSLPHLGHIQISAVHDRGEPDTGEIDYGYLLAAVDAMGWSGYIGAEYKPRSDTDAGLQWLETIHNHRRT
ncbi:MAG: hydroxypyruvate isomerase family protein [Granulosicoccaceae bacterium]